VPASRPSTQPDAAPAGPAHGLAPKYRPADHESRIQAKWIAARAFHADPQRVLRGEAEPYCILIPPPNVTAALHLGHALNNTLQDILVRAHRMKGFETLWMPGTDHAGIATQAVVEKRLRQEGRLTGPLKMAMTREQFVAQVQAWKDEYEATITSQLKAMGCSCDWDRQRFTLDDVCARAVREAFFILFRDGLIYRGKRLVNWDPVSQTALADDEVEMEEVDGHFYYLRYPVVTRGAGTPVTWGELARRGYPGAHAHRSDEPAWVTVATTRPETYLGDTAVAVNPRDTRWPALNGLDVRLPLVNRIIPIIADDYVVMPAADPSAEGVDPKAKYATGFLKVTPAHDVNDYEIGRRHQLPVINVMAPDAGISDRHGWTDVGDAGIFLGLSREIARERVVAEFKSRGLLESIKPYRHSVGHSYRSHVPIEPYLSDQWYVKVTDDRMKGAALRALDSRSAGMEFFPDRYTRTYQSWHENIRDWCISRQLWWGHRIPVWWSPSESETRRAVSEAASGFPNPADGCIHVFDQRACLCVHSRTADALTKQFEDRGWVQDPDVLDTWFSSALWPLSTMGWPDPSRAARDTGIADFPSLLPAFNPTSVLCTAREIITLWVSRMVMFNRYFLPEGWPETGAGGGSTAVAFTPGAGNGPIPFHDVFIHCVIQDGEGQKMSKSLGNGVDPLDIIATHGADALRFVLCEITTQTQDVRMPVDIICPHCSRTFDPRKITIESGHTVAAPVQQCPACSKHCTTSYGLASGKARPTSDAPLAKNTSSRFDKGRNFCTKLWNAARFVMMQLDEGGGAAVDAPHPLDMRRLPLADRWMLSRLVGAIERCDAALSNYEFSVYAQALYDLLWRDFCDWYLEAIKPTVKRNLAQQCVLRAVFDAVLRLLHPVAPFVTEAIYESFARYSRDSVPGLDLPAAARQVSAAAPPLLCISGWPSASASLRDDQAETTFARVQQIIESIRQVRSQQGVEPRRKIVLHAGGETAEIIRSAGGVVESLAGLERIVPEFAADAVRFVFEGQELGLSGLREAVDASSELEMAKSALEKLEKDIAVLESRLNNPGYTSKAPPNLVAQTQAQLDQKRAESRKIRRRIGELES